MDFKQCVQILSGLEKYYTLTKPKEETAKAWFVILKDYEYDNITKACRQLIENDPRDYSSRNFFPPVSLITDIAKDIKNKSANETPGIVLERVRTNINLNQPYSFVSHLILEEDYMKLKAEMTRPQIEEVVMTVEEKKEAIAKYRKIGMNFIADKLENEL